jgi:hypothetical protein
MVGSCGQCICNCPQVQLATLLFILFSPFGGIGG